MIELGTVVLNTNHLQAQKNFYHHLIGLSILNENETSVDLGIEGESEPLVRLEATDLNKENQYGLYHLAILLPSREDLGDVLLHFIRTQTPLQGASNHGYSEAIYLADLDGNGIEIYRDRPKSEWDYQGDKIIGITEAMDAEGVLAVAKEMNPYLMPAGTKMGHVHLTVEEPLESKKYFEEILSITEKFSMGDHATWMANGDYHHHIAANKWAGKLSPIMDPAAPGLKYFVINVKDRSYWEQFMTTISNHLNFVVTHTDNQYLIRDHNGIQILVKKQFN